jgi:hypothetical protein
MKIKIHHRDFNPITSKSLINEEIIKIDKLLDRFEEITHIRFLDETNPELIWIIPGEIVKQSIIQLIIEEGDK